MATTSETMNELYPLAALFVYANNMEITKERIISVLKALGVEGQPKLAELFACDVIKMKSMLTSVSSTAAPAPVSSVAAPAAETKKKEEVKEEPEVEEIGLDFGDLF
ncbi:hypothetical protein NBO_375g0004 [Nosema bombycis CQ1]|uniref:60S acidic ribosomal protein P1 n=2 Tax=Nosema bombycis TaxID=27978 RepID=R0KPT7_NOSB1|nr:60S ribosomal protein P1 [Nosema bombycis]EOB12726.1 hypothetical protein NBO_375g0004 [Nosema bombycis CQ1]|eukprot:EOB12726.1 hypothetical protein NBO_375g0004 [Nosema bombycis CQ1]